jgi:hypothetical protein
LIEDIERIVAEADRLSDRPRPDAIDPADETRVRDHVISDSEEAFASPLRMANTIALIRDFIGRARLVDAHDMLLALEQWSRSTALTEPIE